jgi:LPXTG-site transpeptidase (sortase) family protein
MKLSRINTILLVAIIVINLYIVALPSVPALVFWVRNHGGEAAQKLTDQIKLPADSGNVVGVPSGNRLIVPRMLLSEPVQESGTILGSGVWRHTKTSTPDKGGNTVIIGHRFTYVNPLGSFYNLDKMQTGDEIGLFWQGKRYLYKVTDIKIVPPTDLKIEAPTKSAQLTLYTCTPLHLPKDRLVVVAKPEKTNE